MTKRLPYLVFKNYSSLEFGLLIKEKGSYNAAARDVSYTAIPGRNGDLITDNGRYKNISIPYKFTLLNHSEEDFSSKAHQIKGWLLSEQGYFKLWDSYDSRYFRFACYSDEMNIEQQLEAVGELTLSFNCKPFKYSFEGQKTVTLSEAGTIYNAELFDSAPYIKVVGNGTVTLNINDSAFLIKDIDEYIELDFEMPNAFKGLQPKNNKVSGADMSTFRFKSGFNNISWVGNVEKLEIIPRWCCL